MISHRTQIYTQSRYNCAFHAECIYNGDLCLDLNENYTEPNRSGHYSRKISETTAPIAQEGVLLQKWRLGTTNMFKRGHQIRKELLLYTLMISNDASFIFVSEGIELMVLLKKLFEEMDTAQVRSEE